MRPIQRKSRSGCKECKSRRVKCDELRPVCTKCSTAQRPCSYLNDIPVLPSRSQSSPRPSSPDHATNTAPLVLEPLPNAPGTALATSTVSSSLDPFLNERYSLLHLRLLYHFEHDLGEYMKAAHPGLEIILALFIAEAFTTPYLMDEVLAYSAAHKSTLDDKGTRQFYATEATRLQTRALTVYNTARPEVSDQTCLAMFLFSSLLGHHILFNVSADSHTDLGTILDGLIQSIGVQRGLGAIAGSAWPKFPDVLQRQLLETCVREDETASSPSQGECDDLLRRLETSDLSPSSISVHREAVGLLQSQFDNPCSPLSLRRGLLAAIQDWLIRIPDDYVQSLNQRRPEALVVLAYFAVLLHRGAEYWFLGDLGKRLIHLINDHLGPFWASWLEWPNQMIA